MQKWESIIGIDVSKLTPDIYFSGNKAHLKIKNEASGFKELLKWCKHQKINLEKAIFAMEHTGGYEYKIIQFLTSKQVAFIRLPGLTIKRSLGIVRGKNDKVDAQRIALYVEEKQKSLEPSKPLDPIMMALKKLLSIRKRLVRENAGYKSTVKELKHIGADAVDLFLIAIEVQKIKENERYIEAIETKIKDLITADDELCQSFKLLTSIKGIGSINAWMTIAYTDNFKAFPNARTYAVYVGVVPFDHSSGTSLNGRRKVSVLANKELKQELNQAALSAMTCDEEIRRYATKKKETKHIKIVLNNVKFKLITRMFSIIRKQKPYVDKYKKAA